MRKVLAAVLVAGSLVIGGSTAFAMEREQLIVSAPPAAIVVATLGAATAGNASSAWAPQPDHDLK